MKSFQLLIGMVSALTAVSLRAEVPKVATFVSECLEGDWSKLATVNPAVKYAPTSPLSKGDWLKSPGRDFDCDDCELSRALYRDLWGLESPKFRGDTLNTFRTVLGRELTVTGAVNDVEGYLGTKAQQRFTLSDELKARVKKFYSTYHTLGNFTPLPNEKIKIAGRNTTLNMYRAGIWKDYFGEFLVAVKTYLNGSDDAKAKLPPDFVKLMDVNAFFWDKYRGAFDRYVHDFFLEGYLDEKGEIIRLPIIYWWDRSLTQEAYIDGVVKYLDFAERLIRERTERLVNALKK